MATGTTNRIGEVKSRYDLLKSGSDLSLKQTHWTNSERAEHVGTPEASRTHEKVNEKRLRIE
jgi:hypothetical protein